MCKSCNGTGIYVGFAEKAGLGVVCKDCGGTGYRGSIGIRMHRNDIKWVIQCNPGIMTGGTDYERWGGMSYNDWYSGKEFKPGMEMRLFTCPTWYYQNIDSDKELEGCWFNGAFSSCKSFANKEKCWAEWDSKFSPLPIELAAKRYK